MLTEKYVSTRESLQMNYIMELLKFNGVEISNYLKPNTREDVYKLLKESLDKLVNIDNKTSQQELLLYFLESCLPKFELDVEINKILDEGFLKITNIDLSNLVTFKKSNLVNEKEILNLELDTFKEALDKIEMFKLLALQRDDKPINDQYDFITVTIDNILTSQDDDKKLAATISFIMDDLVKTKSLLLNRKLLEI